MGKIVKRDQACLGCDSSDARQVYENGTSFCFSCREWFPVHPEDGVVEGSHKKEPKSGFTPVVTAKGRLEEIAGFHSRGFVDRKIKKVVTEFYGAKVSTDANGIIDTHYYPYGDKAYKVRKLPKEFTWVGHSTDLFGREKFNPNGKRIVITEGEIDAMAIQQANFDKWGKAYPVVALSSSVMAEQSLLENREWLRTFGEIIICFDEDEAGEKAKDAAIKILGQDKVQLTKLPAKGASDVFMMEDGGQKLLDCIFTAAKRIPSGIITKDALWQAMVDYRNTPSVPYPACFRGVNEKTKGARLGEIALFVSGTSCGKSTAMREIMLSMKNTTPDKIGIVSLEESPAETATKLSGMALFKNPAAIELSLDDLRPGFEEVFGDDRFILLDHQGNMKDDSILEKLEYMALSGCKWIIIDHITILVSEGAGDLTGNEAIDKVMNDLLRFVKRHNVWIGLVSHLRKTQMVSAKSKSFEEGRIPTLDDIKGSGSIKQICFDIIGFARDLTEEDPMKRNAITMSVLKCRYTGLTGPISGAFYDFNTGRLVHISEAPDAAKPVNSSNMTQQSFQPELPAELF